MNRFELAYVEQGYHLPYGYSWATVHSLRAQYEFPEFVVPLVSARGVIAWGVPHVAGKPMAQAAIS